ncbi:MAG: hypothetical protein H6755_00050 [Candidatus Omnitrophica bacterium]|nr:hypothetical protein [Candidatus Omnitrophota bacterium]MCP5251530.1 hypothetical protein [Burkholderiales bacterium]
MTKLNIDSNLLKDIENSSNELKTCVYKAINTFYKNSPQKLSDSEESKTPLPWEKKAIPNLERYHDELLVAIQKYYIGDIKPITLMAASYAGLSKDLDFDTSWMTDQDRIAVQKSIQNLVLAADHLYRIGYEILCSRS